MKRILIILSFLIVISALSDNLKSHLADKIEECRIEEHVSDEEMTKIIHKEIPTSKEGKCFLFCMHKKFGLQSESGGFDKEKAMDLLEQLKEVDEDVYEKVKDISIDCILNVEEHSDSCDTATNFMNCILTKAQEVGLEEEEM